MSLLKIIKKKGLTDIFLVLSFVGALISLILYSVFGVTIFNPHLSLAVIVTLSLVLVLEILLGLFGSKMGKYLAFLLVLYALMEYINSQATYVANVFVAIDGSTLSASFLGTFILMLVSLIGALVSAILAPDEAVLFRKEN
jgi:hypothetical protein